MRFADHLLFFYMIHSKIFIMIEFKILKFILAAKYQNKVTFNNLIIFKFKDFNNMKNYGQYL